MLLTALWILIAMPGLGFAVLSIFRGRAFVRKTLAPNHPELLSSWKVETVRDSLLTAIIGCLVLIGVISAVGLQFGSVLKAVVAVTATVGLFLALVLLDLMAFLNYWLRWGPRR